MAVTTDPQKRPMWLLEARQIAEEIAANLKPRCVNDRCVAAGSVRRKADHVGDIEIVCLPKTGMAKSPGELFQRKQDLVIHWLNTQHHRRHGISIVKGGPRYHQIMYGSAQVDIFMPLPKQWGRMLALRTGPAEYSKKMAARWVEMGYEGVNGELQSIPDDDPTHLIHHPEFLTEKGFFEFLGWEYIKPEKRG